MSIILVAFLISEAALIGCSSSCEESRELENTCGKYCFKIVKTVLKQADMLQKQVSSHEERKNADTQAKLEDFGKQLTLLNEKVSDVQPKFIKIEDPLQSKLDDTQTNYSNIMSQLLVLQEKIDLHNQKLQDIEKKRRDHLSNFTKIGSKYYYIEKKKTKNWLAAAQRCRQLGGNLASIKNQEEFDALTAHLDKKHKYWLDVNDLGYEGEYMSFATGQRAPFLYWHPSYNPDNKFHVEHCITIWYIDKFGMNDESCRGLLYFICEPFNIFEN